MTIANVGSVAVDVVPDTTNFAREMRAKLGDINIHVDLDTTAATLKIRELTANLDRLGHRSPDIGVDVHTLGAEANIAGLMGELAVLEAELVLLGVEFEGVGQVGASSLGEVDAAAASADGTVGTLLGLLGAIPLTLSGIGIAAAVVFAPALVGIGAALSVIAGGLLAVGGLATAGLLPVIAAVVAATGGLNPKNSTIFAELAKSFKVFTDSVKPQVLAIVKDFFLVVNAVLPQLAPVVRAVAPALEQILKSIAGAVVGPGFQAFLSTIERIAPGALVGLATVFGGIASGIGSLLTAFGPTGLEILNGLAHFLSGAGSFGESKGFQNFIDYAKANLPGVKQLFGDIARTVGHLLTVLAPLGPPLIKVLDVVVNWLDQTFLPALENALPVIVRFVGYLIGQLSSVTKFILYGVFGPIINGAADAFGWIRGIGDDLKTARDNFNTFADTVTGDMDKAAAAAGGLADQLLLLQGDYTANLDLRITANGLPIPAGYVGPVLTQSFRGFSEGKKKKVFATGGLIDFGSGTGTSDSVPILASRGEYVVNAAATARNLAQLEAINAGGSAGGDTFYISGPGVDEVARAVIVEQRKRHLLYPMV